MPVFISPDDERVISMKDGAEVDWQKLAMVFAIMAFPDDDERAEKFEEIRSEAEKMHDPEYDAIEMLARPWTPELHCAVRKEIQAGSKNGDQVPGLFNICRLTMTGWRSNDPSVTCPPFDTREAKMPGIEGKMTVPTDKTLSRLPLKAIESYVTQLLKDPEFTEQDEKN